MGGASAAWETGFLACSLAIRVLAGKEGSFAGGIKAMHCSEGAANRQTEREPQPFNFSDPAPQVSRTIKVLKTIRTWACESNLSGHAWGQPGLPPSFRGSGDFG